MNGEQEGSFPSAKETMEKLAEQGLPNIYYSCPGYHSITTARQGMRELLPLLFR
jgi:hypothetical protein